MIIIENKFELGQCVYLKTDPEQRERMVIQIAVGGNNDNIRYCIISGTADTWHYDIELTVEKNILVS